MIYSMDKILQKIGRSSVPPEAKDAFNTWVTLDGVDNLLRLDLQQDELIVYASMYSIFMHAVVAPVSVHEPDVEDLLAWSFNAYESWGIFQSSSLPAAISIEPPLARNTGSKSLNGAEKLVFLRDFEGYLDQRDYFEVLQKMTHLFDLHWVEERAAYCRLDENGDIERVIRRVNFEKKKHGFDGQVISFQREIIDDFLNITDSTLVRMFDVCRFRPDELMGWGKGEERTCGVDRGMFYRLKVIPGHRGYMRGVQLIRPSRSLDDFVRRLEGRPKDREYASFIAYNWKNGQIEEISCAPDALSNYFTESKLPLETSPAFFRGEVLAKYKADFQKYRLTDRDISCRGAWRLKAYDINEEGQVHAYLIDLQHLPYKEQLHWKAHNEKPEGIISKRAFEADFKGQWEHDYDPLVSLRELLARLDTEEVDWWSLREERLLTQVQYPATSSDEEWGNEILLLDQLLVEGFEERWLRGKAKSLGRSVERFRSLKLVEECLIALGYELERAKGVTAPLHQLHSLRSKIKAHSSGSSAVAIKKKALSEHGTYREHFKNLCVECDEAMQAIAQAFQELS